MTSSDKKSDDVVGHDGRVSPRALKEGEINRSLMIHGWAGIALWMSVGLMLEGLLGYKSPAYLLDPQRRELFRLAHSHGVLLSALLIGAALCGRYRPSPRVANHSLRAGSILMPLGFFLSGMWHPEGDPGLAIWMVPPGALLMIFGTIITAMSWKGSRP